MQPINTTYIVYNGIQIAIPDRHFATSLFARSGFTLSDGQVRQIQNYLAALLFWNQRVSLTSLTDPREILERHFVEGMLGAQFIVNQQGRLADVGSGAGFPGIPIRILLSGLRVLLIEQNAKKSAFLAEIARSLRLDGTSVVRSDFAALPSAEDRFDYISSRALGDHNRLLKWAHSRLNAGGKALLWLGESDAKRLTNLGGWRWGHPFAIPHSRSRVILVGTPI